MLGDGVPVKTDVLASLYGVNCEAYAGVTSESKTILGFKVLHLGPKSDDQTDPSNGEVVTTTVEAWLAPDLDCNPLEEISTWKHNGVLIETTRKIATSAIQEGPLASAFEVPAGSVEVPPSAFYQSLGEGYNQRQEDSYNRQKTLRSKA